MSILKEFRNMAGPRGRKPHKPSEPPVYDYQLAAKQSELHENVCEQCITEVLTLYETVPHRGVNTV